MNLPPLLATFIVKIITLNEHLLDNYIFFLLAVRNFSILIALLYYMILYFATLERSTKRIIAVKTRSEAVLRLPLMNMSSR